MTLNTTKTVREVALEVPAATRVFERLKIDYCCGGGRQIDDACAAAGVTLSELSHLLEEAGGTRSESARIQALLAKVCTKHGGTHPELFEVATLFRKLDADLQPHLFKEEQILFP